MVSDKEPRALGAALAGPAFVTRNHRGVMHAADRHVERWAPEANPGRVAAMRSLGFVDRMIAPWMETAQRSASLRLLSGYSRSGVGEHEPRAVSWVFPRPWYQDELDWMAAARQVTAQAAPREASPTLLTTRGTYVPPAPMLAMPSALYEYVAPSLSLAASQHDAVRGTAMGATPARGEAYTPLISLAAVQAAELMSRAVAPLAAQRPGMAATTAMTPGLRSVLASILERASAPGTSGIEPTRLSRMAPELVTPPSPRAGDLSASTTEQTRVAPTAASASATQVADEYAAQRARMIDLQRIAAQSVQRDAAARAETAAAAPSIRSDAAAASELDVRQRSASARVTEAQRHTEAAERARGADRSGAQRLHEQARADAAAHARTAVEPSAGGDRSTAAPALPAEVSLGQRAGSPEMLAAIAGLPPELSSILSSTASQRPERAMQAISELNEALRTVELLARSSAAGTAFEATRGPRLVMPAGLGGLISAVDRAQTVQDRPAVLIGQRPSLPMQSAADQLPAVERRPGRDLRVPTLSWLSAGARPYASPAVAPITALGATTTTSPAALTHVAWADRWLARFAGAAPHSLDMISAVSAASPSARMLALANAAPGTVFVAPDFLRGDLGAEQDAGSTPASFASFGGPSIAGTAASGAAPATSGMPGRLINPMPSEPVLRIADDAETPDDVFAAISAAASRGRAPTPRTAAQQAAAANVAPAAATPMPVTTAADRSTLADLVTHAAPSAPGAGLSAQLAASPFASALRHLLPLPSANIFDVRALFGAGLGATYLAGLMGPGLHELNIGSQNPPTWASWSEAPLNQQLAAGGTDRIDRVVPSFDAAYVAPDGEAVSEAETSLARPGQLGGLIGAGAAGPALTTLRSALLSWELTKTGPLGAAELAPTSFASAAAASPPHRDAWAQTGSTARMMIEAMSLPMLGETAERSPAWSAPGMIADRAHQWSVAQERSSTDLALDFVTPELVLAARVYGLGPAEAAQAARLAMVGPGQLGAMASTVDRTFVDAMAIRHEAQALKADRRRGAAQTYGGDAGDATASSAPGAGEPRAARAITTAFPTAGGEIAAVVGPAIQPGPAAPAPSGSLFGVDRRAPRGAFLWPSAAVAALGMTATGSDGQLSMSVAALELLAAQVVAELGTFTALSDLAAARRGGPERIGGGGYAVDETGPEAAASGPAARLGSLAAADAAARAASGAVPGGFSTGGDASPGAEPGEADVLGSVAALVPASRPARFDALYIALGQSTTSHNWSPAARAARALAIAGRGDDVGTTARERAAAAWAVLPVVYPSGPGRDPAVDGLDGVSPGADVPMSAAAAAMSTYIGQGGVGGAAAAPNAQERGGRFARSFAGPDLGYAASPRDARDGEGWPHVTAAPGLSGLSARAGDALGAYVAPVAAPAAPVADRPASGAGAILRAPTAAPEYVQTSRSAGRYGGGEVEIPPWFEDAARRLLAERSGGDGISLAELTLVNAAPASHVAASTIAQPSAVAPGPTDATSSPGAAPKVDVEKLAHELYQDIMVLMDVARERNGDPYL